MNVYAGVKRMYRDMTGASAREARDWLLMRESRIKALEELIYLREMAIQNEQASSRKIQSDYEIRLKYREDTVLEREARISDLEENVIALEELINLREMAIQNEQATTRKIQSDYEIRLKYREDTVLEREARISDLEENVIALERKAREFCAGMPQVEVDFGRFSRASPQDRALMAWQAADGWCTREKALWLAHLVESRHVTRALEIGVHGGKSLLPIAAVISAWDGVTFGVEPWSPDIAVAEPTTGANDDYWRNLDYNLVKSRFHVAGLKLGLTRHIRMLEISSDQARLALADQRFDLIHLDGSHAPDQALRDIIGWSALLSESGVLVVDDIDWPTLAEGRAYLARHFLALDEFREAGGASYGAYLLRDKPA
ncbi:MULTISPECIES: class I SAM-dependent methyltransferase [Roseomonadaceae]|uniref:Class I SAM-dependent methyltransferase n=1 Tax=Falsiroseomonas oleicola TaxID=2801474 RepID=A0ABS6H5W5_9PROT|nr:class I SAM-dependent methyltransferase [Roseomonas oleicola]MBU8544082.1 class I SAM-dependent methyltransferase [Roseomonas oleicola]